MNEPAAVYIDPAALAAIDAHARAELPLECCGLLVGVADGVLRVVRAVAARNVADQPKRRYLIDPREHFRLQRELRGARGSGPLTIVGVYHSHPVSRPAPSPTDLAEALPHFLYVIASPRGEPERSETRAWWLVDGNFQEIPLVIGS